MRAFIEYLKAFFFREVRSLLGQVERDLRAELIKALNSKVTIVPSYKAGGVQADGLVSKTYKTDKVTIRDGKVTVNNTYLKAHGVTEAQGKEIVDKLKRELDWDKKIR